MTKERGTLTLVEKAQQGDRDAFDELAERYRPDVGATVLARLGDRLRQRLEADDVVQETLLRAFRSIDGFHWQGEKSFLQWLRGIAEHVICEAASTDRRQSTLPLTADPAVSELSQSKAVRRGERFDRLEDALESLSPDHRTVILLARVEHLSMREVASRMSRSPNAATKLLRRALRELRANFGETESLHLPERSLNPSVDTDGE